MGKRTREATWAFWGPGRQAALLCTVLLLAVAGGSLLVTRTHGEAQAAGNGAVIRPAGYNAFTLPRGDNNSSGLVSMPVQVRFFNSRYTQCYVNTNGSVSFRAPWPGFDPSGLAALRDDVFAPLWADVDTTNTAGGTVTYSSAAAPPTVDGHPAFIVTWDGVGYHAGRTDRTNVFQLVIIDRSDLGADSYDVWFNYDQVQWDRATDPVASLGFARSGISQRSPATSWELPGSGTSTQMDGQGNALVSHAQGTTQLGRYVWQFRGTQVTIPPTITLAFATRTLEGNSRIPAPGHSGYSGSADAAAVANGGTALASLVRSPAAGTYLPLGNNTVTWTATDSGGTTATATQSITVVDTTAPSNPTSLTSSTHTAGTWTRQATATVAWSSDATDTCTGVASLRTGWDSSAGGVPATSIPATATAASRTLTDGTWYFHLRAVDAAGNASPVRSFGPILVDTAAPATTSNVPAGWVTDTAYLVYLAATDALSGPGWTRYSLDGAAAQAYSGGLAVPADGTHTLAFNSADAAGNLEATKTATLRLDRQAPTVPPAFTASVLTTGSVGLQWEASTDAVSGISSYRLYRDGALISTQAGLSFTDTGLVAGDTHSYAVEAVDIAGNTGARTPEETVILPVGSLWLTMDQGNVDMGTATPGTPSLLSAATVARVGGVGNINYELSCSAENFTGDTTATPTMPASLLSYATHGQVELAERAFETASVRIANGSGIAGLWQQAYEFDYRLLTTLQAEPDTYRTKVTYTVLQY